MQPTRRQSGLCLGTRSCLAAVLLLGCLLGGRWLAAQTVSASVWPSKLGHGLQSVVVFAAQSREAAEANIQIYDDMPAQQISEIDVAAPGRLAASQSADPPPTIDEEADTLVVNPLKAGAEALRSAPGSSMDFMLMMQLFMAVKPKAYRIVAGVTGTDDVESVAFRNPDGTYVLFTVNHAGSPVSLEVFWKDRLLNFTQAANSIALFAWDPKSPLVSLVPKESGSVAREDGSVSVEAKCSKPSALGIDLRCESQAGRCTVFPVRFTCNAEPGRVTLSVTYSHDGMDTDGEKPGFVTVVAAPDVGEPTRLRVPCARAGR